MKKIRLLLLSSVILVTICTDPALALYNPKTGRWLTRDPIGVQDGLALWYFKDGGLPKQKGHRPIKQYADGANAYQYVNSSPTAKVDPFGTDIYLKSGNQRWNPVIRYGHLKVCADDWRIIARGGEDLKYQKAGLRCFSFGRTVKYRRFPKNTWLGWKMPVPPLCWSGMIYDDTYTAGSVKARKRTIAEQDLKWIEYMRKRVGTRDGYSARKYNCRLYSRKEFADAPQE